MAGCGDMRTVTVIVASSGSAAAIRDVLRDLSAAGLVQEFFWLPDDGGTVSGSSPVSLLRAGAEYPQRLADVLSGTTPIDHVTLCVLVTTVPGDRATGAATELAVSAYLHEHRRNAAEFTRLRVLIPCGAAALPDGAAPVFAGWHNVVIAPEDAHGPGLGHVPLDTDDPVHVARHAAPVLAALCGLWSSVHHRPLDGRLPLPGNTLRVARSFYRRLECGGIAERLRGELFDLGGRIPLPYDRTNPVIYVGDVRQETHRMAEQLWTKHRSLLWGKRERPPADGGLKLLGWREILRMFLSFLWAALKNTPHAWQQRYLDERATATARLIEQLVLGKESAYLVVVKGRTADGRSVNWTAYAPAARQLGTALDGSIAVSMGTIASSDFSALWKDYASAAFTLCDAQERSEELPPAQIGVNRGVVASAADVIRSPELRFELTSEALADRVGIVSLLPADLAGIAALGRRLHELESDRLLGPVAAEAGAALEQWLSGLRMSFGYAFGRRIVTELDNTIEEVRRRIADIGKASRTPETATGRRQRRSALVAQCSMVLFALVTAADVAAAVTERVSAVRALEIGAGVAAALALVLLVVFVRTERALFRLINRRRRAVGTVDADRLNLRTALRDVERLSQAYTQYQSWSHILGLFLADPLGYTGTAAENAAQIRWGLPRKAAVGSGQPDDEQVDEAAAQLRAGLFHVGWMSAPWQQIVGSVGEQLGPTAHEIRMKPELILSQQGAGSGSALDRWAQQLLRDGVPGSGRSSMWQQALRLLGRAADDGSLRNRMVSGVEYFENGVARQVSVTDFRAEVADPVVAQEGHFDTSLFADPAIATQRTAVSPDPAVDFVDKELGWIAVTTQFSDGLSFEDLSFADPQTPPPRWEQSETPSGPTF